MKEGIGISSVGIGMTPENPSYTITFNSNDLHMESLKDIPGEYKSVGKIGLADSEGELFFIIEQVERIY